jgi:GNAT superfamily N-acetyltransferase
VDFRSAAPGDEVGIARVHVLTWQKAYRGMIPDAHLDGLSISKRSENWRVILNELDPRAAGAFVALDGPEVVGFVHFCQSRDGDADTGVGEITAIYVYPEHWGEGIGRGLIQLAIDSLGEAGFSSATLWVLDGNTTTRRFYELGGWKADGATKKDERAGFTLHEVRYARRLRPAF